MFNTIFIQPLFNALIILYQYASFQDLGVAIILLTVIIRFILYPLFYKSFHNQTVIQKLQPEIQKIQHDHKDNREEQAKALLEIYRQHKVNPFSSFFLILIQLPILIALYQVFLAGVSSDALTNLYSFINSPTIINQFFLGLIDLSKKSIIIVSLAAIFQYFNGRLTLPKIESGQEISPTMKVSRQMVWLAPILTVVILYNLPAAVGLYWLTTSVFSLIQQFYISKKVYGPTKTNNSKTDRVDRI